MMKSEPTEGHRISGFQKKQCPWGMKSERKKREKKSMGGPPGGGRPGRHDPWARALEACAGDASLRWRADGKANTRWDAVSAEEWAPEAPPSADFAAIAKARVAKRREGAAVVAGPG